MPSHWHDPRAETQNSGNTLGDRPCVRLSESYFNQFSGNAAAEFTGGPATERIPEASRHNPHRPDFTTPERRAAPLPATTPPPVSLSRPVQIYQDPQGYQMSEQSRDYRKASAHGIMIPLPVSGSTHVSSMSSTYQENAGNFVITEMEENLMRWAEKMGLPNPRENASARQGWPKSSSWDEKESYIQQAAPKSRASGTYGYGNSYNGSSYNGHYDEYGASEQYYDASGHPPPLHNHSNQVMREGLRAPLSDVSGMEERRERSQSIEFRQRLQMKQDLREKLEAGNGDIITWTTMG